jgi:hypothetical protein
MRKVLLLSRRGLGGLLEVGRPLCRLGASVTVSGAGEGHLQATPPLPFRPGTTPTGDRSTQRLTCKPLLAKFQCSCMLLAHLLTLQHEDQRHAVSSTCFRNDLNCLLIFDTQFRMSLSVH